ncbi:AraC family transcriptional regulator [Microbacterium sp. Y-01]|uniref:helix-turn-helix transcriptional regulator n=1 Tax=Microbacterium sp. Y-01 TaxID=2048898 RepID=UPI000F5F9741|nr:helix-turn-helix transcriptional regulator [Microbacterium sp. Y-01]AZH79045.1 AraC family transcriptional regulator [Microbacterium sp. Y-01]
MKHLYQPFLARTTVLRRPIPPSAHDCVMLLVVREGSAFLSSEFEQQPIRLGDAVVLGASSLYGCVPERSITITTICLDTDYLVDQIFWQHTPLLADRLHARQFVKTIYADPAQIISLGETRIALLTPWLDELVTLSNVSPDATHFFRRQALLSSVLDVLAPFVKTTPTRPLASPHARSIPSVPQVRRFIPLRAEARQARDLLQGALSESWTLVALAEQVHLSPKQLSRVFVDAFGKTPITYLTMLRVERMAYLLRNEAISVAAAGKAVGWSSRSRAAEAFRNYTGMTPHQYRCQARTTALRWPR